MLTLERPIAPPTKTHEPSPITNAPYENVSFDLERMTAMLDTEFVPVPKFDNTQDLINWIKNGVRS